MMNQTKSLKYLVAMLVFVSLISSSVVYGIVRPPSFASNTFQAGEQFYLVGSTIEYLGATQEDESLRIELYHHAWTAEINGLSFTFRSVNHPDPIEVLPELRYKGFYTIKVDLDQRNHWDLGRLDVSNLDKTMDKIVSDANTKKIYLNESQLEKRTPAFEKAEDYAIRFYEHRIELTKNQNTAYQETITQNRQDIKDLVDAIQTIDDNLSMLTDSEKKHAENSRNGNLSKISSHENTISVTEKLIQENDFRITLMEAEIEFLRTGNRPVVTQETDQVADENDSVKNEETTTEPTKNVESGEAILEESDGKNGGLNSPRSSRNILSGLISR